MARHHRLYPRDRITLSETIEGWLVVSSIILAVYLIKTDTIAAVVSHVSQFGIIGSFFEGFFFTSVLTTAPAIAAILASAAYVPVWELALVGAFGAVCGDLLVFRFVQSRLADHIVRVAFSPRLMRLGMRLARGPLWWLPFIGGALLIASPFPDEIGLVMMGLSHMTLGRFIPIVFLANAGGIYLMALAAQNLL